MMQRYDLVNKHLSEGGGGAMEATYDGEWVNYKDAKSIIDQLTADNKRLQDIADVDRKFAKKTAEDVVMWKNRAEKAVPFEVRVPNAETVKALEAARDGDVIRAASIDALFAFEDENALCINCGVPMTPNPEPHPREPDYTCPVCGGQIEKRKEDV